MPRWSVSHDEDEKHMYAAGIPENHQSRCRGLDGYLPPFASAVIASAATVTTGSVVVTATARAGQI